MRRCDVAIVGGGIAGASLAIALARDGLDVVVLESSEQYEDRVRGESMLPWGVNEARELGVESVLLAAGGKVATQWVHYDATLPHDMAEANPIPVGMIVPGVDGSLNLRHPIACQALADTAAAAGAEVRRGVSGIELSAGTLPRLRAHGSGGDSIDVTARLVVGADGRNSTVRRQAGIALDRYDEPNMIAGLLVENVAGVPTDRDFIAGEADLFMASFHQAGGRLRVYLCPGVGQRHRFSGPAGLAEFLRSSGFGCLPFGDALAAAAPVGPLATYPGDDSCAAQPFGEGVVLVGDAAGYNNPIIGQGLSIAMRDVRSVRDVIRAGDLSAPAFATYGEERLERLRRLRVAATFMAAAFAEDSDQRDDRRQRFFELQQTQPLAMGLLASMFGGPETAPPDAFDGTLVAAVRGG